MGSSATAEEGLPGLTVHWPKTLIQKGKESLAQQHLRYRFQQPQANRFYCLLLDCSASMLTQQKLSLAKGLILAFSRQVYQQRGELAVIGFRGDEARILKMPGKLTSLNEQWIYSIQGGGGTPLCKGIKAAETLLTQYQWKFPSLAVDCWLLSDGRFRELPSAPEGAANYIVIDFEEGRLRLARAKQLAEQWQADYLRATDLLGTDENAG